MEILKKIEYFVKRIFDRILGSQENQKVLKDNSAEIILKNADKILLLRHDRIGDILVTVPFIKMLRDNFPEIQIDILLSENNISAKRAVQKYVDNLYIYKKNIGEIFKLIKKFRKNNYKVVIDLFDNPSTTSAYLVKFINPVNSVSFQKPNTAHYTHLVELPDKNKVHIVNRILMLLKPFGIYSEKFNLNLEFSVTNEEKHNALEKIGLNKQVLGINLSGSSRAKYWGTDNYIKFIKLFAEKYPSYKIIIFALPDYSDETEKIVSETTAEKSPEAKSFSEYASLLSVCSLILTPDTSAVHLAAAFQIPCVSLHLWTGSQETGLPWTAYNSPNTALKTTNNDLRSIAVKDVMNAFINLIEKAH